MSSSVSLGSIPWIRTSWDAPCPAAACTGGTFRDRCPARVEELLLGGSDRAELGLFAAGADQQLICVEQPGFAFPQSRQFRFLPLVAVAQQLLERLEHRHACIARFARLLVRSSSGRYHVTFHPAAVTPNKYVCSCQTLPAATRGIWASMCGGHALRWFPTSRMPRCCVQALSADTLDSDFKLTERRSGRTQDAWN